MPGYPDRAERVAALQAILDGVAGSAAAAVGATDAVAAPSCDDDVIEVIDLTINDSDEGDSAMVDVSPSGCNSGSSTPVEWANERAARVSVVDDSSMVVSSRCGATGNVMWFITEGEAHERIDFRDPAWKGRIGEFLGGNFGSSFCIF